MFATSAPYVVTILMSVITWVLSTYYQDISTTPYLRYEVVEDGRTAQPPYETYRFTNASPKVRISGVTIGLDCPGSEECFGVAGSPSDASAQMLKVPPWAMPDAIEPSPSIVQQKIDLPAGTAFEIKLVLRTKDVKPFLYFQSGPDQKVDLKLITGCTLDEIVANNYLAIVTTLWIIACAIIMLAYYRATATKPTNTPDKPELIHLKIIRD
ncbi:hypothetical protein FJ987_09705 [Mesorhizobium sp. CU2]|uniref:hypothetical protein n=1 Tax=unclassified Mesorhizobium TaxID=325217 RepID=UPI0011293860|nr:MULTISPECIES: hypothetical protein [unclassified Mesorhizobium]TPN86428.1 hypothetical protein FJ988_06470 [Mesorhizobium sp. CU3]TPO17207.1 hypothetical protein FJ987_09705 [Mesorhizobium sp. CU2]